jgi:ABC-type dipeptide/oligopeptide/nickel transport system permease component
MHRYLVRRLLLTIPVLLGVATLVFSLIHFIPGDPAQAMLGEGAAPEDVAQLRERLGLDRPLLVQYGSFLGGLARGDLGVSLRKRPAGAAADCRTHAGDRGAGVRRRWPSPCSSRCRSALSRPSGGAQAVDYGAMTLSLVGISIPNFWLGPLLAIVFAVELGWLPVGGRGTLAHLVLPAVTLGAALAAILARMTRASLLEELREPYVLAARAKGVSRTRAILHHAFRNSLIPSSPSSACNSASCSPGPSSPRPSLRGRHRPLVDPVDQLSRLPDGARLRAPDRRHLRRRQPDHRS